MIPSPGQDTLRELRALLLRLAHHQDELGTDEKAATPYWAPCAPTVLGHFSAAAALRAEADQILCAIRQV